MCGFSRASTSIPRISRSGRFARSAAASSPSPQPTSRMRLPVGASLANHDDKTSTRRSMTIRLCNSPTASKSVSPPTPYTTLVFPRASSRQPWARAKELRVRGERFSERALRDFLRAFCVEASIQLLKAPASSLPIRPGIPAIRLINQHLQSKSLRPSPSAVTLLWSRKIARRRSVAAARFSTVFLAVHTSCSSLFRPSLQRIYCAH